MNLKSLSREALLSKTKTLVSEERKMTLQVLLHLQEINLRRLHLELKYGSMHEYAMKELGYSENEANARISAMRLMADVPEVEEKISQGSLSLTNAVKIQSCFYQTAKTETPFTTEQKIEIIESLENKSTRECEKELLKIAPKDFCPREKERQLSEDHTEYRIVVPSKLKAKIEKVRSLISHQKPNASLTELLDILCDQMIKQKDITQKKPRAPKKPAAKKKTDESCAQKKRSIIPAADQRAVWIRDESCCAFSDGVGGQRCRSTHLVQIDHVIPLYYGGDNSIENMRLLCFAHHQFVTEIAFGMR